MSVNEYQRTLQEIDNHYIIGMRSGAAKRLNFFSIKGKQFRKLQKNTAFPSSEQKIRRKLLRHFHDIGLNVFTTWRPIVNSKDDIRLFHKKQRIQKWKDTKIFVKQASPRLLKFFASGTEVCPTRIMPRLQLIESGTWESDLFRLASLTWSVPVSQGYGRRMRFLVWDDYNHKLIGIFALGDPVFNLKVRDKLIGWTTEQRKERLVNVMDAYVLGAIPPYNALLCGKMVTCLIRSRDVKDAFAQKYGNYRGIISGKKKSASLALVTTTSALGKSSVYDRLKLNGQHYFEPIGFTAGWGHFHIPEKLFEQMRHYLARHKHWYNKNHQYGDGPNWRLRVVRETLQRIGLNPDILRHGINREVFMCKLASNAERFLRGEANRPYCKNLLSASAVADLALERWIIPRAARKPEFALWKHENMLQLINPHCFDRPANVIFQSEHKESPEIHEQQNR